MIGIIIGVFIGAGLTLFAGLVLRCLAQAAIERKFYEDIHDVQRELDQRNALNERANHIVNREKKP